MLITENWRVEKMAFPEFQEWNIHYEMQYQMHQASSNLFTSMLAKTKVWSCHPF